MNATQLRLKHREIHMLHSLEKELTHMLNQTRNASQRRPVLARLHAVQQAQHALTGAHARKMRVSPET